MQHAILFSGHMIDKVDRKEPRFPASKEEKATLAIRAKLLALQQKFINLTGLASGACGGDIIFHEQCRDLGIPTEMYLASTATTFKNTSVSFAGEQWNKRFDRLLNEIPVYELPPSFEDEGLDIWTRTNLWMLDVSMGNGPDNMTLMLLWDGRKGDGAGGTQHLAEEAGQQGAGLIHIDINSI